MDGTILVNAATLAVVLGGRILAIAKIVTILAIAASGAFIIGGRNNPCHCCNRNLFKGLSTLLDKISRLVKNILTMFDNYIKYKFRILIF